MLLVLSAVMIQGFCVGENIDYRGFAHAAGFAAVRRFLRFLVISIRQVARPSLGSCIVKVRCRNENTLSRNKLRFVLCIKLMYLVYSMHFGVMSASLRDFIINRIPRIHFHRVP